MDIGSLGPIEWAVVLAAGAVALAAVAAVVAAIAWAAGRRPPS